ncbi:MAG: hypothetical protein IPN90_10015 [Elusimicrobia bacterium]|nr:hypothetical protein [Elusimicrobiota bacterium]
MNSTFTVRKARRGDIDRIVELVREATERGKVLKRSRDDIRKRLGCFYIADVRDKIVGCCVLEVYNRKLAEIRF